MLGTFILWFGWYGFNAGSSIEIGSEIRPAVIARTVVNTTLAGASAGIVSLFANLIAHERKTG
jgi:Amt family ammonium transporter